MPPIIAQVDEVSLSSFEVIQNKPFGDKEEANTRRSVWFNEEADEKYEIEPIRNEEKESLWYSKEEFAFIETRNALVVELVESGVFKESNKFTARGLEPWIEEREDRYDALDAVLQEQFQQSAAGVVRPRRIARACRNASRECRKFALRVGLEDARVAWGVEDNASMFDAPPPEADVVDFTNYGEEDETTGRYYDDYIIEEVAASATPPPKARREKKPYQSPMKKLKNFLTSPKKRTTRSSKIAATLTATLTSPQRCSEGVLISPSRARHVGEFAGLPTLSL